MFGCALVCTLIEIPFAIVESNEAVVQGSDCYHSPSSSSSLSEFMGTTPSYGQSSDDDGDAVPIEIEVHCEITTQHGPPIPVQLVKNVLNTILEMVHTKQTAKKQGTQGTSTKFGGGGGGGGKGPLKGKAAKQLAMQVTGVGAHRWKCKDHCPVMPHGALDDASTRRKKWYLPGTKSLLEIAYYQKRVGLLVSKLSFERVVREITKDIGEYRYQRSAILALQEGVEGYLVGLFEETSWKQYTEDGWL